MIMLEAHPYATIFPLIDGDAFDSLVEDIRQNGVMEPIVLLDGKILDGRNRYRAATVAGIECPSEEYLGNNPLSYVVSLNLKRRHLDESQRSMVAKRLEAFKQGDNRHTVSDMPIGMSRDDAATLLNVGTRSVARASQVLERGSEELIAAVDAGRVAVSAAADVATLPKSDQTEIVAKGERAILEAAKNIRIQKAEVRRAENAAKALANPVMIPAGKYGTLVIDPPWDMKKIERDVAPDQVDFDYPTMSESELVAFGETVRSMLADDAHVFIWTTQKYLPMSLRLLEPWGLRYVYVGTWHKPGGFQPFGLPQYNAEPYIYARAGSPQFVETKAFNICNAWPRREHSRKPDEFYDLIRRVTAGPRIDIFSREKRDGFDQFGNEVNKFAEAS